jgi:hypothetical protein
VVAGTAGGSPVPHAWIDSIAEADRARLRDRHVEAPPHVAAYPDQTGRGIPMVRVTRGAG